MSPCPSTRLLIPFYNVIGFFFKQKTAYEIGLGIPAEPLFRSPHRNQQPYKGEPLKATSYMAVGFYVAKYVNKKSDRSEERRVGKECRCWWSGKPYDKKRESEELLIAK